MKNIRKLVQNVNNRKMFLLRVRYIVITVSLRIAFPVVQWSVCCQGSRVERLRVRIPGAFIPKARYPWLASTNKPKWLLVKIFSARGKLAETPLSRNCLQQQSTQTQAFSLNKQKEFIFIKLNLNTFNDVYLRKYCCSVILWSHLTRF